MERCENCGKEVNENELHEVINFEADEVQHVCTHCLEFYTKCDQCGMYRPNEYVEFEPEIKSNLCNFCREARNREGMVPVEEMDLEEESWRD